MKITKENYSSDGWSGVRYFFRSTSGENLYDPIWVMVPDAFSDFLSDRLEAGVMAGVFGAMLQGESLEVDGDLSIRFHYGIRQMMSYFALWYPDRLQEVNVIAGGGVKAFQGSATATCGCFSGGLDSFHSLFQHRRESEPVEEMRMTHGVFVHGLDLSLSKSGYYETLAQRYESILGEMGVTLLRCKSNFREVMEPHLPWMTLHGAALHVVAHALSSKIRRFIIPSTNRFSLINPPIGSNPITDPYPGTESLDIWHHGCSSSRAEKMLEVASWQPVREHLRVCFQEDAETLNCGKCVKCQKIMLILWLTGQLDKFSVFPQEPFDPSAIPSECFKKFNPDRYPPELPFSEEMRALAERLRPEALRYIPEQRQGSETVEFPEMRKGLLASLRHWMPRDGRG